MPKQDMLLTIAIPTFNRASCLELCLSKLLPQTEAYRDSIEVIISDNCSTDNTNEVVNSFINRDNNFIYVKNAENIGPDDNFLQCFMMAKGKYVLILGDDDILLDDSVQIIVNAITNKDYGCVYIRGYGFRNNYQQEYPKKKKGNGQLMEFGPAGFITRTNVMLTFISGNIVNKGMVSADLDYTWFKQTNLLQLSWVLSAAVNAQKNLYINKLCLAIKNDNSGGYDLCKVFGVNLEEICRYFEKSGVNSTIFRGIRFKILGDFLPRSIVGFRKKSPCFDTRECFTMLKPTFRKYFLFWIGIAPALYLPTSIAGFWGKILRLVTKIILVVPNMPEVGVQKKRLCCNRNGLQRPAPRV